MTVEEAIVMRLQAISPLASLVSTRIYLEKLPQTPTYPCVRVTLVSELGAGHLRGADAMKPATVQVDAYAREVSGVDPYAMANAVAAAVHGDDAGSGLSGWAGDVGGSPASRVLGCQRIERRRYYDAEELRVVTMSQDYQVHFKA